MPAANFYRYLGFQEVAKKEIRELIDDPKVEEEIVFFEWINPV